MSFETDLKTWGKMEDYIIEVLKNKGWNAWKNTNPNKLKEYDVIAQKGDKEYKIEVKTDMVSMYTGNIGIEQRAIQNSRCHFFFYVVPKVYAISMEQMGKFIKENKSTRGGDFNDLITLVPVEEFERNSKQL